MVHFCVVVFVCLCASVWLQWCLFLQERVVTEIYSLAMTERNQQALCQVGRKEGKGGREVGGRSGGREGRWERWEGGEVGGKGGRGGGKENGGRGKVES